MILPFRLGFAVLMWSSLSLWLLGLLCGLFVLFAVGLFWAVAGCVVFFSRFVCSPAYLILSPYPTQVQRSSRCRSTTVESPRICAVRGHLGKCPEHRIDPAGQSEYVVDRGRLDNNCEGVRAERSVESRCELQRLLEGQGRKYARELRRNAEDSQRRSERRQGTERRGLGRQRRSRQKTVKKLRARFKQVLRDVEFDLPHRGIDARLPLFGHHSDLGCPCVPCGLWPKTR